MSLERAEQFKHYWEYGPNPTNPFDSALRNALELWNYGWIGETKSHGWEWYRMDYPQDYIGTRFEGNPKAFKLLRGRLRFLSGIAMEGRWKFGWDQIRVIQPDLERIGSTRLQDLESWRYGWSPAWKELKRAFLDACRINIYPDQAIKVMVGPRPFNVHGVGSDELEVPLKVSGPLSRRKTRNDPRFRNIPLF